MKKILSVLFVAYFTIGCSATHQAKVRDKINSDKNKKPKKEILAATSTIKITKDAITEYIDQYKEVAMENMKTYGIPASIKLAQAILESGSGKGKLATQANNHFGIKCKSVWSGEVMYHNDDAPDECFRKYNSPTESFNDHSLFLTSRAHYSPLFQLDKSDYKAWANGLKKAGYATDPNYPNKLIGLIERYELYQYDAIVLGQGYTHTAQTTTTTNHNQTHQVEKGDTLYNISMKYNISIEELKKINNLSGTTISIGQILKLK